jgi:hypothetical protein
METSLPTLPIGSIKKLVTISTNIWGLGKEILAFLAICWCLCRFPATGDSDLIQWLQFH